MHKLFWICLLLPGLVSCVAPSLAPPNIIGEGSWHEDRDMLGVFSYLKIDLKENKKSYTSVIKDLPIDSYAYGFGVRRDKCSSQIDAYLRVDIKNEFNEDNKLYEGNPFKIIDVSFPKKHMGFFPHKGGDLVVTVRVDRLDYVGFRDCALSLYVGTY